MTKIARPQNKTMREIAEDWSKDRVNDLEAFGQLIRFRTICEAWYVLCKNYGVDVNLEEFRKAMEE